MAVRYQKPVSMRELPPAEQLRRKRDEEILVEKKTNPNASYGVRREEKPFQGVKLTSANPTGTAPPTQTATAPAGSPAVEEKPLATVQPTQGSPAQPGQVSIQPRAVSPQVQEILDMLRAKIQGFSTSNVDIQNDPAYQAQKRVIDQNRGMAQAQLRRGLSSRNMLRSTPAIQALASSDAFYTGQEDALVPQMLAEARTRALQEIRNYESLLGAQTGVENTAFSQGLSEFQATAPYNLQTQGQQIQQSQFERTFPLQEAGVTGRYVRPEVEQIIRGIIQAKQDYATDPEGSTARAELLRRQLAGYGINPALFGADVPIEQAIQNFNALGRTPQSQAQDLEQRRQQLEIEVAELKLAAQREGNPNAKELARIELATKQAELDKIKAQIGEYTTQSQANVALANQRNREEPKKDPEAAKAEKRNESVIENYTRDFNVSRLGAEGWAELLDTWSEEDVPLEQKQQDLAIILNNKPGLSYQDKAWLNLMFQSAYMSNTTAQSALNKPPFRRKDISE